jgi:hypothetical protein
VAADLKATDQNKGTKPVFKGVNPLAATTAGDLRSIQTRRFRRLSAVGWTPPYHNFLRSY